MVFYKSCWIQIGNCNRQEFSECFYKWPERYYPRFRAEKERLIHKSATEFEVFKSYENSDTDIIIRFSNNNFEESYSKQKKNFVSFAKMFSFFDDIVSNAIGVEVHNRNKVGYKPDPTLNAVYVLIGAFNDGKYIVPE